MKAYTGEDGLIDLMGDHPATRKVGVYIESPIMSKTEANELIKGIPTHLKVEYDYQSITNFSGKVHLSLIGTPNQAIDFITNYDDSYEYEFYRA